MPWHAGEPRATRPLTLRVRRPMAQGQPRLAQGQSRLAQGQPRLAPSPPASAASSTVWGTVMSSAAWRCATAAAHRVAGATLPASRRATRALPAPQPPERCWPSGMRAVAASASAGAPHWRQWPPGTQRSPPPRRATRRASTRDQARHRTRPRDAPSPPRNRTRSRRRPNARATTATRPRDSCALPHTWRTARGVARPVAPRPPAVRRRNTPRHAAGCRGMNHSWDSPSGARSVSCTRSLARARCSRDMTVPMGISRISAMSA